MFNLFGEGAKDTEHKDDLQAKTKNVVIPVDTVRRTEEEVSRLVQTFKQKILNSKECRARVEYFWWSEEEKDAMLYSIARDIPKDKDPLKAEKIIDEDFKKILKKESNEDDEEEERNNKTKQKKKDIAQIARQQTEGSETNTHNRKKRISSECVEWLGIVNKKTRFAAIKLRLPETFDSWYTFVNRLLVYVFANIPNYTTTDDFHKLLNVNPNEPFFMLCRNPLCVRLSHIDYQS